MLIEYFSDRVMDADDENPLNVPENYTKYDYQMDAVVEGYQKLLRYDGFFLADVVGLGKTVIATMIAKKFLQENGRDNTKNTCGISPGCGAELENHFQRFWH